MMSKEDRLMRIKYWTEIERDIRRFFTVRGFVEVRAPILVASPGMEPNLTPFETTLKLVHPKRESTLGLITSPEYSMKKLIGSGVEKAFTITPVFRNEEGTDGRHLPEFVMLEWYAPGGFEELMDETEELLQTLLKSDAPFDRIRYENAHVDVTGTPNPQSTRFFITNFPKDQAALARVGEDGSAERFESYVDGLELTNGFCELIDPVEQRRRFEQEAGERRAEGKTVFPIDEGLLTALSSIKEPYYGNALGLDRVLMVKYRKSDINDVQVFPADERY